MGATWRMALFSNAVEKIGWSLGLLDMVVLLIPEVKRQRQVEYYELKASLVSRVSACPARATQ